MSVVTMTNLDPMRTNADPLCTLVVPSGIASLPATIVVAVQDTATIQLPVAVQCPKTLEPVTEPVVPAPTPLMVTPAPLMATPAPLLPTVEPVADPDPPVANCVPTVGDIPPVAVIVAEKTPVTIQSFETPQPMTTPLPAGMTPLIFASPAPLLAAMVPVADALPHVADCDPLSALGTPVAIVVAVLTSVTVQSLQAIQPVTTPCVTTPTPVVMRPHPLVLAMIAVALPDPLVADRVPISTLTTPVTVVVAVQDPVPVQGAQTIQPVPAPLVVTPLPEVAAPPPLVTTMMAVTNLYPVMFDRHPLSLLITPMAVETAIKPPVAVQRLETVQPVTTPMESAGAPLIVAPTPLIPAMVAMTDPDPLMTYCVPSRTKLAPMALVVAVQGLVPIQRLQAVQPVATPMVVAPLPSVSTPSPLSATMQAMANLNPTMPYGYPLVTNDTLTTMVVPVQPPQTVLRLKTVQPMASPLPLTVAPLVVAGPTPLLPSMVTMADPNPLVAVRVPDRADMTPAAVVVLVQGPVTLQTPQTPQPVSTPVVADPTPPEATPTPLSAAVVTVTDTDPTMTNGKPTIPDVAPVAIVVAIESSISVQSLETPQPMATPVPALMTPLIVASPSPLLATIVTVTNTHPLMTFGNPLRTLVAPVAVVIAVQTPVTEQRSQAVKPVTTPVVATPTPLMLTPTPLVPAVVTMTLPNPLVADRVPFSTHTTPVTAVVAIQNLVSVQGAQAVQPVSPPLVVTPSPH